MPIMPMVKNIWHKMNHLTPAKYVAVSMVLKDAVGCYMYTTTARANKAYSPEKRADVANYDLANGIINIGLQISLIKPIEKAMDKVSLKCVVPHFFKNYKELVEKNTTEFLKRRSKYIKGSSAILSTIICQYLIKRFVSPYFSMPTAEKFQQWGLVKPKLYPGETFGKESVQDRFKFYLNNIISFTSNKANDLKSIVKETNKK